MATYAVESRNLDKLRKAFEQSPKIVEKRLQDAIGASIAELHKNAVKGVVPWRTGYLTHSFGLGILIGRLFGRIRPTAEYAIYVHEGTRPHVIKARKGGGLFWKGAAHPVKSVQHPGTKPNRFMPRVLDKAKDRIEGHFKRALELVAADIAK
ncbi:MAG: HK97 gp10 family phage protein [Candidatus Paceibacterota bacterium]|jgi:hypothetical protein